MRSHILRGINGDLIATEAKFHKNCFWVYVLKKDPDYEASFQGKAYEMNSLLAQYQQSATKLVDTLCLNSSF